MNRVSALYVGNESALVDFFTRIDQNCGIGWTGASVADRASVGEFLSNNECDLILVDADLNGSDGYDLLEQMRREHPAILRFVVADPNKKQEMVRLLTVAHQAIARPYKIEGLCRQLKNGIGLHNLLSSDALTARISAIQSLPCLPETYSKLTAELANDSASAKRVAELVSADAAVTAKLLQIVNSAFFGLSRRVEDVIHAVNLVGFDTVRSLVLTAGAFDSFKGLNVPDSSIDEIYSASLNVGARSRLLAHSFGVHARDTEDSLLGGMLHTIGKLVMAKYFREELIEALELCRETRISLSAAEEKVLGVNDAAVGAYLLSLWGLSNPIVEAVALYQQPSRCSEVVLGPLTFVHLGWAMTDDERRRVRDEKDSSVDNDYLEKLGLRGQLTALRGYCAGARV